ncbi:MAG: alpha/beta hydrolase [Maribacter sp.]
MRFKSAVAFILFGILISVSSVSAQRLDGVTGVRDTSYTSISAFRKDVKKYPQIKLVPEFSLKSVSEERYVPYCSMGKRELELDVFQEKDQKDSLRTAIIMVHGGGWRSGDRSQHYPLVQKLASLGYVCFTPEYRLSTEALFPAAVYDLKSAIRWVRANAKKYSVNPEKIVIAGFSAGGELAAFLGTTGNSPLFEGDGCEKDVSSHVNAIIDMDGTLSFVHPDSGEGDDRKGTSAATYWFGYSKKENPVLWEVASPLSHVGKNTPPTLFINSSVDRMHAGRDDYMLVLKANSIYSEVIGFDTAPHSFVLYHPWFEPVVQGIDDFLNRIF